MHRAAVPYLPASVRQCMISFALTHRILQSEDGFHSDRAMLSTRLQTHRGEAIRRLAIELQATSLANAAVLACVMTFLFAEVCRSDMHGISSCPRFV